MPSSPPSTHGLRLAADAHHVALVVNPGSRRGAQAYDEVHLRLREHGFPRLTVHPVEHGDLAATLDVALSMGPDLLVVGGGDGTIGCAASKIAGTEITLGVLPLGTANDFARTLQIPADPHAAMDSLLAGRVVDVDLGRVGHGADDWAFLNVASMGLSVGVTERLTPGLKRRLGPAAYPLATLRALRHHRPFSARLEFPDGDRETVELTDLLQVAVGNGKHYGGGLTVAPEASVDDHLLDVYAIERGRLRDHVSVARLLRSGHFVEHERVHHLTCRRVRITTDLEQPVNLDGEVVTTTPAEFRVERNAVHVVVPLASDAATLDGPADQPA